MYKRTKKAITITPPTRGWCNLEPKIQCAAMRGRGEGWQQTLEVNKENVTNTITSVQKDNLIIEENYVKQIELINGTNDGCASTLTTGKDCASHITNPKGGHKQMGVKETITYKGRELKEGESLYINDSKDFFAGGSDVARTLKSSKHDVGVVHKIRIRKLTERECFRLMGVEDADIDKIQAAGISKTQQYKMAGNSIVVDVLYHIFKKMFVETRAEANVQLELF